MTALRGDSGRPDTTTWWHAFGQVRDDMGGCWQLVVIGPATQGPDVARGMSGRSWGPYLSSWDHQPSNAEKDEVTPEEYRDEAAS